MTTLRDLLRVADTCSQCGGGNHGEFRVKVVTPIQKPLYSSMPTQAWDMAPGYFQSQDGSVTAILQSVLKQCGLLETHIHDVPDFWAIERFWTMVF